MRLAGQITGVEGYLESAASGLAIALYLILERRGEEPRPLPINSALGSLARHITESRAKSFQPANVNYGLFEPLTGRRAGRRERRRLYAERAAEELGRWMDRHGFDRERPVAAVSAGDGESVVRNGYRLGQ